MIIAKNGTFYNNLSNDIILAHATYVASPFAKVDRELNYKKIDEGEFSYTELVDDFTQEELKAGFYEVAKYCTSETLKTYADKHFSDDLEIQRYIKLNELKKIKDEKLSEFSYNDKIYQIDENSKVNLNGKVSAILLAQNTEQPITQISWIAKDNTITQFTTLEFLAFSNAVAEYIEMILFLNDKVRTQINEAESIEALKTIELKLENEA
ncbi:MAG: DUF4376 domain-containing protein [Campylobacter sp.]|nr:DUF4376 domain-containing protein [Campylobacter sp.]